MEPMQISQSSLSSDPSLPLKVISGSSTKTISKKNFPETLFDLLNTGAHDDILKWTAGGTAFIITDRKRFTNETLPLYFKGTQYKSFIRKLNRWKFRRITQGPHVGAYQHEFFKRADRSLCRFMSCSAVNGTCTERNGIDPRTPSHDTADPQLLLFLKNSNDPGPCAASDPSVKDVLKKYMMLEREMTILKRNSRLMEMQLKLAGLAAHNTVGPPQELYPLLSRNSCYSGTRQKKIKSILKSRTAPRINASLPHQESQLLLLRQIEARQQRMKIEKKKRLVMMKAEEVKLLTDIKYLLATTQLTKLRILAQQSRAA